LRTLILVIGACTPEGPETGGHHTSSDPTGSDPTAQVTDTDTDADTPPPVPCQADTSELRGLDIDVFENIVRFGSYDGASGRFDPLAPVNSVASLLNHQEGVVDPDAGLFTVLTADAANVPWLLTVDHATGATVWEHPLASSMMGSSTTG